MKKTISVILSLLLLTCFAAGVSASSMKPGTSTAHDIKVTLKKADPDKVIKDGEIGEDEYERYYVDTNIVTTPLVLVWAGDKFQASKNMMETMEYYFSWDEVHGFNFAVKYKPETIVQQIPLKKGPTPEDGIMNNCAIAICMNAKLRSAEKEYFYVSIGKSTLDGSYLFGHWNQRGLSKKYRPVGGEDFEISYKDDGYAVFEWSIPFSEVLPDTSSLTGKKVYFTISAMGGDSKTDDFSSCYGVTFGEGGYLVLTEPENVHASAVITDVKVGEAFADVKKSDYFYDSVKWASSSGITAGMTETRFCPNDFCTRGQIVTFLHRAKGRPVPANVSIFADIKEEDYFYSAVLWAAQNDIAKGVSDKTFGPKQTCTRAQAVTFLWRACAEERESGGGGNNPFADVKPGAYYEEAVKWAVENGITKGTSETAFSPDETCTRGQIVTFLYRAFR